MVPQNCSVYLNEEVAMQQVASFRGSGYSSSYIYISFLLDLDLAHLSKTLIPIHTLISTAITINDTSIFVDHVINLDGAISLLLQ